MKKMNTNLHRAAKEKNDEFYTLYNDIEKEIINYKNEFYNKTIYCNCDDPEWSNFWKYFSNAFDLLGIKKLISTHYKKGEISYKLEMNKKDEVIKTFLKSDGDFRNQECIDILTEADIVITNPPFSLFREYVAQLVEYEKKFLIIGPLNAITYKEIFKLIQNNKLWKGINNVKEFTNVENEKITFGNINWYTNIQQYKRNEKLLLSKNINENIYVNYDNCNAIEVSKIKDIPLDYKGIMGVPITFLDKYNPEQFEIIRFRKGDDGRDLCINGKPTYFRILIKNKNI